MNLENNNIKVLKIFFWFSIEKSRKIFTKFWKILENIEKCLRQFSKFLQNLENIFLKKIKIRKHQQLNCFEVTNIL